LLHDPRISLISHDQNDSRIQTEGRITVVGEAHPLEGRNLYAARWLRHFPENEQLFALGDFCFYRLMPNAVRHIAGFGQARWYNSHFTVLPSPLIQEEEALLAQLNSTARDILCAICHNRLQLNPVDVRAVGIDCDGLALSVDGRMLRCDFAQPVTDGIGADAQIAQLAAPLSR
ncbi:MAG: pyridoxamine 5'-phosphate oxidase, partial [Gallionella sp.]|nr:pyridoxamine 5'-phosphate oxidase [Gallionella sp.]